MSFDANGVICTDINKAALELLDEATVRRTAVCEVFSTVVYDGEQPRAGGVHDARLGPMDSEPRRGDPSCVTCGGRDDCPGHLGYIQLHLPAFHPLFIPSLLKVLKSTCLSCRRLKVDPAELEERLREEGAHEVFRDISASSANIEHWRRIVKDVFLQMAQSPCLHCGRKPALTIRKRDLDSAIELQWNFDSDCPVDRAVLLKMINEELERSRLGLDEGSEDLPQTLRDIRNVANVDDVMVAKDHRVLGRRGKALGNVQLQAYQVYPIIRDLFNSPDRKLLQFLIPSTGKHGADFFFMNVVPVSSNKFRPKAKSLGYGEEQGDASGGILHPRSSALLEILGENHKVGFSLAALRYPAAAVREHVRELPAFMAFKDKESAAALTAQHVGNYSLLHQYCRTLQEKINAYIDNTKTSARNPPPAIRQWMEKKSGAIRQKMMGKRVNYAARTTIAPDAQINTNEIGIPIPFAMKLTIAEHATAQNVELLCKLIMNGSKQYPGCNMIIEPGGRKLDLTRRDLTEGQRRMQCKLLRNHVTNQAAGTYTVLRHLRDGDVVVMNRQPSLHRASMMAHFIRVLTGQKTFRLHYANCNSYNADFDGDEMNMHCAQDPAARAEAALVINADCNYTVAKSGEPLRGLIQDHVLGANFLTIRGTFLTRAEYFNLIYVGVALFTDKGDRLDLTNGKVVRAEFTAGDPYARALGSKNLKIVTEPPTIFKPEPLWTGKQVINAILKTLIDFVAVLEYGTVKAGTKHSVNYEFLENYKGINLVSKSKTPGDAWMGRLGSDKEEQTVIIRNSELLQGVFDKAQIGASSYGLVHLCYELFGPRVAGMLLSVFARVFTCYLQMRGFSCSSGDFQMTLEGEHARQQMIARCTAAGTLLQEQFIDSVYQHMHWQEHISNASNVNTKYFQASKVLEDLATDEGRHKYYKKRAQQLAVIEEAQQTVTADGIVNKDYKTTDDGQSVAQLDANNSWNQCRHIMSTPQQPDWRLNNLDAICDWMQKEIARLKELGASDHDTRQFVLQAFTTTPELCVYLPNLARLVGADKLHDMEALKKRVLLASAPRSLGAAPPPFADVKPSKKKEKKVEETTVRPPPTANRQSTLLSGRQVAGDGALKAPVKYHPSWAWSDAQLSKDLPFESPLRYIVRELSLDRERMLGAELYESSGKRLMMIMPSELTRLRMERLISDYFAGREEMFITMFDKFFQANMGQLSSKNNDLVSGDVTLYPFPQNGFSSMVTTGAKGSKVNFAMICGMLSQQSLEGKRVPLMISGKSHPAFGRWDLGARAGGLITDRYLTGLRPPDYFFHCMAGREGLVDTAVKTARSGYLQRCVIKSMEGMVVSYDGSVREGDGSVVQFLYGEDGADVCKMTYLHNVKDLLANPAVIRAKFAAEDKLKNPILEERMQKVEDELKLRQKRSDDSTTASSDDEPMSATHPPLLYPGSVSEWFEGSANAQLKKTLDGNALLGHDLVESGLLRKSEWKKGNYMARPDGSLTTLGKVLRLKYRQSLAEPGDAVGCLAAQSMGEPATQMTLNTFHLAGHGAANVTLGIPRLREILQTAGNASTPVMYLPVLGADAETRATNTKKLLLGFKKIKFTDVVNSVGVEANVYGEIPGKPGRGCDEFALKRNLEDPRYAGGLLRKYWEYEATIQFENLDHFCRVVPKYTPQKLINFTINRVVKELMKTVNKLMAVYATKASDEMWGSDEDELTIAAEKFVFERHMKTVYDRKKALKELFKAAGIGFGGAATDRNADGVTDIDLLAGDDGGTIYRKGARKLRNDEVEDGQDELGDNEFDTDVSNDDSEDDLTDPNGSDGEVAEQEDEEEVAPPAEEAHDETDAETDIEMLTEEERKSIKKDAKKRLKRMARLDEMQPDQLEDEAVWSEGEGAAFRSRHPPSEAYRYLKSIRVCRRTWRVVIKWNWPVERCPRKIEFLPSLVRIVQKQVLQDTPGVQNPHVVTKQDAHTVMSNGQKVDCEVQCEGSNLLWVSQLADTCVDHTRVSTNDIRAIFQFYGVEAGRTAIIRELASVFGVYGITVDFRHLSLIADAMTSSGEFRAFSRLGMSYHPSPLLQMSFETSIKFLTEGVERGAVDNLRCPAGAIFVGRSTNVGTGLSRSLVNLNAAKAPVF